MYNKRLSEHFETAARVDINNQSKIVFFSDCHRGDGSNADNFAKNEALYLYALKCYYNCGYTYIELGDGDELWENKLLSDIVSAHENVYKLLERFNKSGRMYLLYGNHDMAKCGKKNSDCVNSYFNSEENGNTDESNDVNFYEALVLKYCGSNREILAVHGNQVDFMNYDLWRLTRGLVRYFWRPIESMGFRDPTNASKNRKRRMSVETYLTEWAKDNVPIIAGHTHMPYFPQEGEPPYFNSGSCVSPGSITCIEINGGKIALVKWKYEIKTDGTVSAVREVIGGPVPLSNYFNGKDEDLVPFI